MNELSIITTSAIIVIAIAFSAWLSIPVLLIDRTKSRTKTGYRTISDRDYADLENQYRRTVAQALGGVILLIGALLTYYQIRETSRSTDLSNSNLQIAKGFELLGKPSGVERSGGIRILEVWADDASNEAERKKRYAILVPSLISFIRDRVKLPEEKIWTEWCEDFRQTRPGSLTVGDDVQLALNVLTQRAIDKSNNEGEPIKLNFRALNLSRADFSGGDFRGSNFAFADLSEANLSNTKLQGANFYCANLYRANLAGADLSGGLPTSKDPQANLAGVLLTRADLSGTDLKGANLVGAQLTEAVLKRTDLRSANLFKAKFYRSKIEEIQIDSETIVDSTCFVGVEKAKAVFSGAKNIEQSEWADSEGKLEPGSYCALDARVQNGYAKGK